jgi:hypothetical protein
MPARVSRYARADAGHGSAFGLGLLRPAGHLHQHAQRLDDGALPHRASADRAKAALAVADPPVARGDREVHEANRFAGHGAARPRNARDGHRQIDAGPLQRADRHLRGGFLADGAEGRKRRGLDAEHRALGVVRISDKAAVDHIGGAGDVGQRAGDQAAGAGLCGRNGELSAAAQIEQRTGKSVGADLTFASHLPRLPQAKVK